MWRPVEMSMIRLRTAMSVGGKVETGRDVCVRRMGGICRVEVVLHTGMSVCMCVKSGRAETGSDVCYEREWAGFGRVEDSGVCA